MFEFEEVSPSKPVKKKKEATQETSKYEYAREEELKIIPTGVPGFDEILGGGLVEQYFYVFAGTPGSGKTITTQQIALNWLEKGIKVFVILTETTPNKWVVTYRPFAKKLIQYNRSGQLLLMTWWRLKQQYKDRVGDISGVYGKAKMVVEAVKDAVEEHRVGLVIIDSVTTLFENVPSQGRAAVSYLQQSLSRLGVVTIAIAQYGGESGVYGGLGVEHAADGVVRFSRIQDRDGYVHFTVQVVKHRGMRHSRLVHPLIITEDKGVIVLPNYRVYYYRGNYILVKVKNEEELYIPPQEQKALEGAEIGRIVRKQDEEETRDSYRHEKSKSEESKKENEDDIELELEPIEESSSEESKEAEKDMETIF